MKSNDEWAKKVKEELGLITTPIFLKYWQAQFGRIYHAHSYTTEFELECCTVDYDFVRYLFASELQKIAIDNKMKFIERNENKSGTTFCLAYLRNGFGDLYSPKIYVQVGRNSINLKISPGICESKRFQFFEYKTFLLIVSDLAGVDFTELCNSIKETYDKNWINEKNSKLAADSIDTLCKNLLGKKDIHYLLHTSALKAVIGYENMFHKWIQKTVFYNEFNENPGSVVAFLQSIKNDCK